MAPAQSLERLLLRLLTWRAIFCNRAMNTQENESLCARLSREVYNRLNLVNCLCSEFFFKEMTNILNLQGMERWPLTEAGETNSSQLLFSMVIFSPLKEVPDKLPSRSKITKAHTLAREMFHTSFSEEEDHDSIDPAMDSFPTVGIYMCVIVERRGKGRKNDPRQEQSLSTKVLLVFVCSTSLGTVPNTPRFCGWPPHRKPLLLPAFIPYGKGIGWLPTSCTF